MSEKNYKSAQCIGHVLCTTPLLKESIEGISDWGVYLGKESDVDDINARLEIVKTVLSYALQNGEESSDVLKVFVMPEFFWRGVKGAYYYPDSASDEFYLSIQAGLNTILENYKTQYDIGDWLFVFGSILTTNSITNVETEIDETLSKIGDEYIAIYDLLRTNSNECVGDIKQLLRIADRKLVAENSTDDKLSALLESILTIADESATKEIYNRSLIYYDGEWINVQKKNKSKEDFILNNPSENNNIVNKYLQTMVVYPDVEEVSPITTLPFSCFECGNLKIGVEICLDHSRKRLLDYLCKEKISQLNLQIVPSCGMNLRKDSIAVSYDTGLLFNCDGEYTLSDDEAHNGNTSHSELKRGTYSASCGPRLSNELSVSKIIDLTSEINVNNLFPKDAGQLHIYEIYSCV
ncbi:MAG: hypothetical protein R3Y68_09590 [Rikenellaceae bacterium]